MPGIDFVALYSAGWSCLIGYALRVRRFGRRRNKPGWLREQRTATLLKIAKRQILALTLRRSPRSGTTLEEHPDASNREIAKPVLSAGLPIIDVFARMGRVCVA